MLFYIFDIPHQGVEACRRATYNTCVQCEGAEPGLSNVLRSLDVVVMLTLCWSVSVIPEPQNVQSLRQRACCNI